MLFKTVLAQQNAAHLVEQHVVFKLKILPTHQLILWKNPHLALSPFAFDFVIGIS